MFSARTFKVSGEENFKTPPEYTQRAREDVNRRLFGIQHPQTIADSALKYGSSPLRNNSITASSLEAANSSDDAVSVESDKSQTSASSKKKFFNFLHRTKSNESNKMSKLRSGESLSSIAESMDADGDELSKIPSYTSSAEQSLRHSLFSNPLTNIFTTSTTATEPSVRPVHAITLAEAIPRDFSDMYAPDLVTEKFPDGRPTFTKRDLVDWELNDVRSLLIVEKLRPEWNGVFPQIQSVIPLRLQYLPLDTSDELFVQSLVESDIYKESHFDYEFRYKSAKFIVSSARLRHAATLINEYNVPQECFAEDGNFLPHIKDTYYSSFLKHEWRNIIENFLLNLAVESQCRHDFKTVCAAIKRERMNLNTADLQKKSLLVKAIMSSSGQGPLPKTKPKLSHEEKTHIWANVQANVYHRLNLDWKPDIVTT